jgi:nucleotidyltransferase/DNA polymerase involved in DNA repair
MPPTTPAKTFAHIDCDCFFVSAELIDKPHLKGKPVCVAGPTGNKGVVTSASYEARKFNIKAGTPVFKARQLCPQAIFIPGDFQKYGPLSFKLFAYLQKLSPKIEHMSIDEGYADLSNLDKVYNLDFLTLGQKFQTFIDQKLKIPISIGIAPSKTLAKIGSKLAKPHGVIIINDQNRIELINGLKTSMVCGFGRRICAKLLANFGIETIEQFIKLDPITIKKHFGSPVLIIWHELQGQSLLPIKQTQEPAKSIMRSSMFPTKTNNYEFIKNWLTMRLIEATKKLQTQNLNCQKLGIFLRQEHPHTVSIDQELKTPSHNYQELKDLSHNLLQKLYQPNRQYRAAGIYLANLKPQNSNQPSLFAATEINKKDPIEILNFCDQQLGKNQVSILSHKLKPEFGLSFMG